MKRPTYFISCRSSSADILGAELVLAIREQHSKVEGYSIAGNAIIRTRIPVIGKLLAFKKSGLHENGAITPEAKTLKSAILEELDNLHPQVAILVGYSVFHHDLAKYFKSRSIPVVLYGLTPPRVWEKVDLGQAMKLVDWVIGLTPKPPKYLSEIKCAYNFVGSPLRDRVDRVKISHEALGLDNKSDYVALMPGNSIEEFKLLMPTMLKIIGDYSKKFPNSKALCSLPESVYQEVKSNKHKFLGQIKLLNGNSSIEIIEANSIRFFPGMALELMSLSQLVITGLGASTVEAALMKKPLISIHNDVVQGSLSLANQIAGREIHREFSVNEKCSSVVEYLSKIFNDSAELDSLVVNISSLRGILTGFAADNAADLIGRDVALWSIKKKDKGALPA